MKNTKEFKTLLIPEKFFKIYNFITFFLPIIELINKYWNFQNYIVFDECIGADK